MNPKMFFIFFYATTILLLLCFEKLQIAHNIFWGHLLYPNKTNYADKTSTRRFLK